MRLSEPSGPARSSNIATNSPTTTGGNPKPLFATASIVLRPRNRPRPIANPIGTPITIARNAAHNVVRSVTLSTDQRSGVGCNRSCHACCRPSQMKCTGRYLPRVFLEQWLRGIKRTYIYELVDVGAGKGDNGYGLLHADFTPKPAFTAIKNMLGLLADPGPSFKPGGLDLKLSGGNANVQHLLLQKRDGRFYLALWVEAPCFDMNSKQWTPVPATNVTIAVGEALRMTTHRLDDSGNVQTTALGTGTTQTIEVSDIVTIVEISQ